MRPALSTVLLALSVSAVFADTYKVHSVQQTVAGSQTNIIEDAVLDAGEGRCYSTVGAPVIDGWIFTHWSISTFQPGQYKNRDERGRALEAAEYVLYADLFKDFYDGLIYVHCQIENFKMKIES